jgi:hypothetical protein
MPDPQQSRKQQARRKKAKQAIALPPPPLSKETPQIPPRLSGIADAPDGGTPDSAHPSWRLALLDLEVEHEGNWSWNVADQNDLEKITAFLTQMEALTLA